MATDPLALRFAGYDISEMEPPEEHDDLAVSMGTTTATGRTVGDVRERLSHCYWTEAKDGGVILHRSRIIWGAALRFSRERLALDEEHETLDAVFPASYAWVLKSIAVALRYYTLVCFGAPRPNAEARIVAVPEGIVAIEVRAATFRLRFGL